MIYINDLFSLQTHLCIILCLHLATDDDNFTVRQTNRRNRTV